jgi:hypothetical protein
MATIVTRAGKGSALTHNEVDANFNNLNNDKIETSVIGNAPNEIPLNQYLGDMAYQSAAGVVVQQLRVNSSSGIGYSTGSGSTVTQATSRTTGVTINSICGAITLVSAAGSPSFQSFVVTNSAVSATDTVIVNQKSGTDKYIIHVTNVSNGSFELTFATTNNLIANIDAAGGTTTEQPVFNFAIIKSVTA